MLVPLLALVAVLILIIVYVVLQSNKKTKDKGDKLFNRNVPPFDPDAAKTGAPDAE